MPLHLTPLTSEEFPGWLTKSQTEYQSDLVATGLSPAESLARAAQSIQGAFPEGSPHPTKAVFHLIDNEGSVVGYLWVGRDQSDDPTSWWVWDIFVEPSYRGRGFGRVGMQLAEEYAVSHGATTLGLNVFGFNHAARGLYESLGYETTSVKMRKTLTAP
ncbi:GNAT family N-acetyltransferase [Leucobacter viscericola]|uniref:GNAT family N-acetyltransferase n=1 Tax=Leucobacter viscericola TaxID=2714935 RepID=A0A6G7XEJ4_9MICO|nr:GNAT family N-acetyltransferase [Leucobacter viscericola]QIK62869.1 GNAT family N-acetyltransferase [Leucobacter viscericola]